MSKSTFKILFYLRKNYLNKEGQKKDDREIISTLTHQLMPLWEIVRIDAPLKELL